MSHQSHCLVFSLIFLSLLNPLQSGSGLLFQSPPITKQTSTQQNGDKKSDKQPQPTNDPKQTDILKQYPHVPPPTPTQTGDQEQPGKSKSPFGQKLPAGSEINFSYDRVEKKGDITTFDGYVDVTFGSYRLQADKVVWNEKTKDITATGNVVFDADISARVTAERADVNADTKLGTFYNATGFTSRTHDGQSLYFTAEKIEKTGLETYVLTNATVTSCLNAIPTWSFRSKKTTIKVHDRASLNGADFRLRNFPLVYVPFGSLPISERGHKSGFLIPTTGSSTQKGRTFSIPYYQTLGRSADLVLRGDIFTARALGLGYEFRVKTDEQSSLRLGGLIVKDGLFGYNGPNQGGSSFYAYGGQYLPHGFVAVADANITSSLTFRQVFSQDYEEIVNPEERSTFYVNRNFNGYSFNLLGQARTTTIQVGSQTTFTPAINIRQLPQVEFSSQSRPFFKDPHHRWQFYFSFDTAVSAVHRDEEINDISIFSSPSVVQRMDFFPKITVPLPPIGGWSITPSLGLRTTFYSDSLDPTAPLFDPVRFALTATDPRLDPHSPQFNPAITLFNPLARPRIDSNDLTRFYSELAIDFRPPVIGKVYRKPDGTRRFTHIIEPYITYRRIDGLSNFAFVPRFDDIDAVARTNQLEYSIVNRFFRTRTSSATNETPQSQEFLSIKLSQYYFFDPTFGGALVPGQRNQFYPLNTLTSFSSSGFPRRFSPLNLQVRYRPVSTMYADVRMDYDTRSKVFRDIVATGGFNARKFLVEQTWYYARRIFLPDGTVEAGTFFGSQYRTTFIYGNRDRGWYGGTSLNFNLINRSVSGVSPVPRVLRSSTFIGYMGQCCGVELGYQTFDTGLRVESRFSFSFTLAGIGSVGTRNRIGERGLDREGWELDRLSPYTTSR